MARKTDNVIDGSGNVFADIGLDQPEEVEVKARIVDAIADLLESQGITQQKAGKLVKLTQPQISRLMRGDTREFSYERLMHILLPYFFGRLRSWHSPKCRGSVCRESEDVA